MITATDTLTDSSAILDYLDTIATDDDKLHPIDPINRQQVEELVPTMLDR